MRERPPHPATAQPKRATFQIPKVLPPHPATVPRTMVAHPVTVQRKGNFPGARPSYPPHKAVVDYGLTPGLRPQHYAPGALRKPSGAFDLAPPNAARGIQRSSRKEDLPKVETDKDRKRRLKGEVQSLRDKATKLKLQPKDRDELKTALAEVESELDAGKLDWAEKLLGGPRDGLATHSDTAGKTDDAKGEEEAKSEAKDSKDSSRTKATGTKGKPESKDELIEALQVLVRRHQMLVAPKEAKTIRNGQSRLGKGDITRAGLTKKGVNEFIETLTADSLTTTDHPKNPNYRHDIQNAGSSAQLKEFYNYQIQLGGSQLQYPKGQKDTSVTEVIADPRIIDEISDDGGTLGDLAAILRLAHRLSLRDACKIIWTKNDDTGEKFITARSPKE